MLLRGLAALATLSVLAVGVVAAIRAPVEVVSTRWGTTWSHTTSSLFKVQARTGGVHLLDEEIYVGTLHGVAAGNGYYASHHAMLQQNPGRWNTHSPLTYRQPLLAYVWVFIGAGAAIGMLWAILAASSTVAAYVVAERLLNGGWPAVLAPLGLALVYDISQLHPPRILFAETWAAPMVVLAAAFCALVLLSESATPTTSWALSGGGAAAALVAMLLRELALPFAAVMGLALLVDRRTRAHRLWLPWAGAVVLWIGAYVLHVSRVHIIAIDDPPFRQSQADLIASYFHPGLGFLAACLRWVSRSAVVLPAVAGLWALALIGLGRLRRWSLFTLIGGVSLGSLAALTLTGTFGVFADGNYTGYWGYIFIPPVLAWSPLGLKDPVLGPAPAEKRRRRSGGP